MSASRAELESELIELYEVIDEREARIEALEYELRHAQSNHSKSGGVTFSSKLRKSEHDNNAVTDLQNQLLIIKDENADLRAKQQHLQQENEELRLNQNELTSQLKSQQNLVNIHKRRLSSLSKITDDYRRQKKDEHGQHYQLELENKTLRDSVKTMEDAEEDLVAELELATLDRDDYAKKVEYWEAKCGIVQIELDDCEKLNFQLENDLSIVGSRIEKQNREKEALKIQHEHECRTLRHKIECSESQLARERQRSEQLEKDLIALKGESIQGILTQKNIALSEEIEGLREKLQISLQSQEETEAELKNTARNLNNLKVQHEQHVCDAVTLERKRYLCLEKQLNECNQQQSDLKSMNADLEIAQTKLIHKLRYAEDRNKRYEESNGIKVSAAHQRKLESDIIRRDLDIATLNEKIGKVHDKLKLLEAANNIMKGMISSDHKMFVDDDDELKQMMDISNNKYELEITELQRQNEMLEKERLMYLQQLRENAIDVGAKGYQLWGLDANQIRQVNEFANNIRNGVQQLPLDDRSKELKEEVVELNTEYSIAQRKIDQLEKELLVLRTFEESRCDNNNNVFELEAIHTLLKEIKGNGIHCEQSDLANKVILVDSHTMTEPESDTHDLGQMLREDSFHEANATAINEVGCQVSNETSFISSYINESYEAIINELQSSGNQTAKDPVEVSSILAINQELHSYQYSSESNIQHLDLVATNKALLEKVKDLESQCRVLNMKSVRLAALVEENSNLSNEVKRLKQANDDIEAVLHANPNTFHISEDPMRSVLCIEDKMMTSTNCSENHKDAGNKKTICENLLDQQRTLISDSSQPAMLNEVDKHIPTKILNERKNLASLSRQYETALDTINSMKELLRTKNCTIDDYKRKFQRERELHLKEKTKNVRDTKEILNIYNHDKEDATKRLKDLLQETNVHGCSNEVYVEALTSQVKIAEDKFSQLENELNEVKETRDNISKKAKDYFEEIERMKTDMDTVASQLLTTSKHLETANSMNEKMEQEIDMLKAQKRSNESKIDILRSTILKFKQGVSAENKHRIHQEQLNTKSCNGQSEVMNLRIELQKSRTAKEKCIRSLKATRTKADKALDDAAKFDEQARSQRQLINDLKREVTLLRNKLRRVIMSSQDTTCFNCKSPNESKEDKQAFLVIEKLKQRVLELSRQNSKLRGQLALRIVKREELEKNIIPKRDPLSSVKNKSKPQSNHNLPHVRYKELENKVMKLTKENKNLQSALHQVDHGKLTQIEQRAKAALDRIKKLDDSGKITKIDTSTLKRKGEQRHENKMSAP